MKGNAVTARRLAGIFSSLGLAVGFWPETPDSPGWLVALHARKSAVAIAEWARRFPDRPIVLVLTGTDLYQDIPARDTAALRSLELANHIVVMQKAALADVPEPFRAKTRAILKSVAPFGPAATIEPTEKFRVAVVGHLRAVKDPLLAAQAARLLPVASNIEVLLLGESLEPECAAQAEREMRGNPRFRWLGGFSRDQTAAWIRTCRLTINSSHLEGGANAVAESIALGVPVLATKISGNVGLLGKNYPGYFPISDATSLADLLWRAESDPAFLAELRTHTTALQPAFKPEREAAEWRELFLEGPR